MKVYSKVARFLIFVVISFGLAACSAKPKQSWKTNNSTAAKLGKIKKIKTSCRYNKRLENSANQLMTALMANKKMLRKVSHKHYLKRANKTLASLKSCMSARALKRTKT